MQIEQSLRRKLLLRTAALMGTLALMLAISVAWLYHVNSVTRSAAGLGFSIGQQRVWLNNYAQLQHLSLLNQSRGNWAVFMQNRRDADVAAQRLEEAIRTVAGSDMFRKDAEYEALIGKVWGGWQEMLAHSGQLLRSDSFSEHQDEMLGEVSRKAEELDRQLAFTQKRFDTLFGELQEDLRAVQYLLLIAAFLLLVALAVYVYRFLLVPMVQLNTQLRNHEKELETRVEARTMELNAALREREIELRAREEAERRFEYLATHDTLTGLPNRALVMDRMRQLVIIGKRDNEPFAVLLIDLNNFKAVNDAMGHHVGDALLSSMAKRLLACVREEDTVARLGGDEFVVVMPGVEDDAAMAVVVDKILDVVAQPCMVHEHEINGGCSVGISLFPRHGEVAEELLKFADIAMYAVKGGGVRHNYAVFDADMAERVSYRHELEIELRKALRDGMLELHYQPQVSMGSGRLMGAEALLRWNHPQMGWIAPADFVPVAEDAGLIHELGEWVLRAACRQLALWQEAYTLSDFCMAVNISAQQIDGDFPALYLDVLRQTGIAASSMELEITESVMMENPAEKIPMLREIASTGTRIAMDDFGTGYSSLSYLTRFSIHRLKVDQSFVRNLGRSADFAVASTIIAMARNLNLDVIAEGIEEAGEAAMLEKMGCIHGQGYLFGRPVPPREFEHRYLSISSYSPAHPRRVPHTA